MVVDVVTEPSYWEVTVVKARRLEEAVGVSMMTVPICPEAVGKIVIELVSEPG